MANNGIIIPSKIEYKRQRNYNTFEDFGSFSLEIKPRSEIAKLRKEIKYVKKDIPGSLETLNGFVTKKYPKTIVSDKWGSSILANYLAGEANFKEARYLKKTISKLVDLVREDLKEFIEEDGLVKEFSLDGFNYFKNKGHFLYRTVFDILEDKVVMRNMIYSANFDFKKKSLKAFEFLPLFKLINIGLIERSLDYIIYSALTKESIDYINKFKNLPLSITSILGFGNVISDYSFVAYTKFLNLEEQDKALEAANSLRKELAQYEDILISCAYILRFESQNKRMLTDNYNGLIEKSTKKEALSNPLWDILQKHDKVYEKAMKHIDKELKKVKLSNKARSLEGFLCPPSNYNFYA